MDLEILLITCNKFKRLPPEDEGEEDGIAITYQQQQRQANLMQWQLFQYEIKFNFL